MLKLPLPKQLKSLADEFVKLDRAGKDANNKANQQKTLLRNGIKDYWAKNHMPIGSFIRTSGFEFRFEANETSSLDGDAILAQYDKKEITREQMVRMLKIDAGEAKKILGADQVADLEVKTVGDKIDVRMTSLPVENDDDEYVMARRLIRKKVKRSVFGREHSAEKETTSAPVRRRIKTKGNK